MPPRGHRRRDVFGALSEDEDDDADGDGESDPGFDWGASDDDSRDPYESDGW